jgi:hypothetical protein
VIRPCTGSQVVAPEPGPGPRSTAGDQQAQWPRPEIACWPACRSRRWCPTVRFFRASVFSRRDTSAGFGRLASTRFRTPAQASPRPSYERPASGPRGRLIESTRRGAPAVERPPVGNGTRHPSHAPQGASTNGRAADAASAFSVRALGRQRGRNLSSPSSAHPGNRCSFIESCQRGPP